MRRRLWLNNGCGARRADDSAPLEARGQLGLYPSKRMKTLFSDTESKIYFRWPRESSPGDSNQESDRPQSLSQRADVQCSRLAGRRGQGTQARRACKEKRADRREAKRDLRAGEAWNAEVLCHRNQALSKMEHGMPKAQGCCPGLRRSYWILLARLTCN